MIDRYVREQMKEIWSDRNRYRLWLNVELSVCEEMAKEKIMTKKEFSELKSKCDAILKKGGLDPAQIEAAEQVTKHDILAFTTVLAQNVGPLSRFIHFGLTSSDVVDTALAMQISQAGEIIKKSIETFIELLTKKAREFQKVATIGRSHGMFAEPTSFGLKFLGWSQEWKRNLNRVDRALAELKVGKCSGAVGVNSHWSPKQEVNILKRLGLQREAVSTQVIPRDRHAELFFAFAACGGSMERIAVELRHLQRSEVAELREGFRKGQKGSSAMPHKRNPISSENLTGCARLLRSYVQASLENIALWHERDISHSSVERVLFPDSFQLLDYAIHRLTQLIEGLEIDAHRVKANLDSAGQTSFSGHFLLKLVQKGVSREDAYGWIQECALGSIDKNDKHTGVSQTFLNLISQHEQIRKHLSDKEIKQLGSLDYQLRNVPEIFETCKRIR